MATELQMEVYKQLRTAQEKYIYFLLAAAGAGIALAVNQTQTAKLGYAHLPLGVAVALWALSFYFGCRHLAYVESTLYANAEFLKVQAGEHPQVGSHPQLVAAASEGIRNAMETNSTRAGRLARAQFLCLALGAVSFIAWHILQMWLRS